MPRHPGLNKQRPLKALGKLLARYWRGAWWHKLVAVIVVIVVILTGTMYGIAQWYIHSERSKPLQEGVSFIPDYASSLGLDPQQTMDALTGIGIKNFRLVSYWSDGEPTPGHYDFSQLDWELKKAEAAHVKVILTVGLRQPRWPECHAPDWADTSQPESKWQPQLEAYMKAVIERYKNSPALQQYQLENEYFLHGFGTCTNYDRNRLISEYDLVKKLDPSHPIIVPRSDNGVGIAVHKPQPDELSISVYKRVWEATFTHRYFEYPQPAWYYGFLAGWQKLATGKDTIIGELQAEAWTPNGQTIQQTSLAEQNNSLNAKRLKDRFQYGRATGMRQIYLWGAEYWYYHNIKLHDPSLWNVAKQEFKEQ